MGWDAETDEMVQQRRCQWKERCDQEPTHENDLLTKLATFVCPSEKTPVECARLLGQLDLEPLEDRLLKLYKKKPHFLPVPMLKASLLARRIKVGGRGIRRYLLARPDEARMLDFVNEDGDVEIPSREKFRTFMGERLDWDSIRDGFVAELARAAEPYGIKLGAVVTEDATPFETIGKDPDGKYNGHYEKTCVKEDIVTCKATGVPVSNETIGGTECEASCQPRQLDRLQKLGIRVEDSYNDNTYAALENLAIGNVVYGTRIHHQVAVNWVMRKDGEPDNIKRLYQEFRRDPNFRPDASLHERMLFLVRKAQAIVAEGEAVQQKALSNGAWGEKKRPKRGRPTNAERAAQVRYFEGKRITGRSQRFFDAVGAYFRNQRMRAFLSDPDAVSRDKGPRQGSESMNNHMKNDIGLQDSLRVKGIPKIHRHFTMGIVFLLAMALVKVQHGVTKNLASLVGIE